MLHIIVLDTILAVIISKVTENLHMARNK